MLTAAQVFTASAAIIALLYFLRNILIPLVIAFVLAVLVEQLCSDAQQLSG